MNPTETNGQDVLPPITLDVDALDLNLDVNTFAGGAEEQEGDLGVPVAAHTWSFWCRYTRTWLCRPPRPSSSCY